MTAMGQQEALDEAAADEAARGTGQADAAELFAGPGEVRALARALDWGATPLGWPHTWSPALRIAARAMLDAPFPICLWSGPEYALVYNDAYRRILTAKHPASLGQPGAVVWAEIWAGLEPQFAGVRAGGPAVFFEDARFEMARLEGGGTEDAWFSYSLSPLRDEDGQVVAVLNISPETTGRVRAEQALALERTRLETVFRQSPSFLAVLRGPDNVFELVNEAYRQLIGHRRDVIGRALFDAIPEARGQGFDELLGRVRATGEPLVFRDLPALLQRTPGEPPEQHFLDITYLPLIEADGTYEAIAAHGTDVTDQVRARRELETVNVQLQENAVELEMQAEELQATAAQLEERTEAAEEAVEALATSEARARRLADAMPVQVWTAQPDGALDFVNEQGTRFFGVSADVLLGDRWGAFVHPDDVPGALTRWEAARDAGTPYEAEFRLRGGDGRYRWHLARAVPEHDGAGVVTGWIGTNTDVEASKAARAAAESLQRQAEAAQRRAERAQRDAETATRAKSEFLATMSHEIRTPINAVLGYADLLGLGIAGSLTERQHDYLNRLTLSGRHLLGLIDEVLDTARVESGRMTVEHERVDLATAAEAALALVRPQAAARGLRLGWASELDDRSRPFLGDEARVRQILVNLLANAVKFTDPRTGSAADGERAADIQLTYGMTAEGPSDDRPSSAAPDIQATPAEATPAEPWLFARVTDRGIGIPADALERIFEPFVQVEQGHTRTRGGSGLGLAISRRLARLMGGDLTAASTLHEGSTFTLWLPAAASGDEDALLAGTRYATAHLRASIVALGEWLAGQAEVIAATFADRVRDDAAVAAAQALSEVDLRNHLMTYLADLATTLVAAADSDEPTAARLDSTDIQQFVSERHGAQRFRLGYTEPMVAREHAVLGEIIADTVRRGAPHAARPAVGRGIEVLQRFVADAEQVARRSFRRAADQRQGGERADP